MALDKKEVIDKIYPNLRSRKQANHSMLYPNGIWSIRSEVDTNGLKR